MLSDHSSHLEFLEKGGRPNAAHADDLPAVGKMEEEQAIVTDGALDRARAPSSGWPAIWSKISYWSDQNQGRPVQRSPAPSGRQ
jgi:hypothetical protein